MAASIAEERRDAEKEASSGPETSFDRTQRRRREGEGERQAPEWFKSCELRRLSGLSPRSYVGGGKGGREEPQSAENQSSAFLSP